MDVTYTYEFVCCKFLFKFSIRVLAKKQQNNKYTLNKIKSDPSSDRAATVKSNICACCTICITRLMHLCINYMIKRNVSRKCALAVNIALETHAKSFSRNRSEPA